MVKIKHLRICGRCYKRKSSKHFYKTGSYCKSCAKEYHKIWWEGKPRAHIRAPRPIKLLPDSVICVKIPRRFLLKCLKADDLSGKDKKKILHKNSEIEKIKNKLLHASSVVYKIIDKHTDKRSFSLK